MSRNDVPAQRWTCDWTECEQTPVLPSPVHPDGWLRLHYGDKDFCSEEHLIFWLNTLTLSGGDRFALRHLSDLLHIEVSGVG